MGKECGQFRVYTEKPSKAWLGQARHAVQIAGSPSFQTEPGTSAKVLRPQGARRVGGTAQRRTGLKWAHRDEMHRFGRQNS